MRLHLHNHPQSPVMAVGVIGVGGLPRRDVLRLVREILRLRPSHAATPGNFRALLRPSSCLKLLLMSLNRLLNRTHVLLLLQERKSLILKDQSIDLQGRGFNSCTTLLYLRIAAQAFIADSIPENDISVPVLRSGFHRSLLGFAAQGSVRLSPTIPFNALYLYKSYRTSFFRSSVRHQQNDPTLWGRFGRTSGAFSSSPSSFSWLPW